ncbi:MAG TPA: hypothetical protein DCR15_18145 [Arthrobacter bacterium]|nr:hypothetical protein [Arthrobacter sp.]
MLECPRSHSTSLQASSPRLLAAWLIESAGRGKVGFAIPGLPAVSAEESSILRLPPSRLRSYPELVLGQRTTDPQELLRYGTASGRSFQTFTDYLLGPCKEAALILKNRPTAITITITMEDIDQLTDKQATSL